jgi:hypothetical protein
MGAELKMQEKKQAGSDVKNGVLAGRLRVRATNPNRKAYGNA